MATADLVTQLKQDFDDVYAAGKAAGGGSGVDYSMYAKQIQLRPAAIEQEEVTFDLDNAITLAMFFNSTTEGDDNIAIKSITVNCPNKIEAMNAAFFCHRTYNDNVLEKVTLNVDTSNCTTIRLAFRGCRALKTIGGTPLDLSKCTASNSTENTFQYCYALQDVGFAKETIKVNISFAYSNLLSTDTIQSIIDGLADLTQYYKVGTQISTDEFEYPETEVKFEDVVSVYSSGYTMSDGALVYKVYVPDGSIYYAYKKVSDPQTLTLHADVKAKLTDEQKATITAKNWLLA